MCGHGVEMMIHRAPNVEVESAGSTRGVECDLRCMSWWRGFMGLLVEYTGRLITLHLCKSRSLLFTSPLALVTSSVDITQNFYNVTDSREHFNDFVPACWSN